MLEEERKLECQSPRLSHEFSKVKRPMSPSFLERRQKMGTLSDGRQSPVGLTVLNKYALNGGTPAKEEEKKE